MWVPSLRAIAENLVAGWVAELFSPSGMTGLAIALAFALVWLIRWHRDQRRAKKSGMASWYFIIPSAVVAIFAIALAAYGLGLRSTTSSDKAESPPPAPVTVYELQRRQRAYDELLAVLEGPIQAASTQAVEINNTAMVNLGKSGTAGLAETLKRFKESNAPSFADWNAKVEKYQGYLGIDLSGWSNNIIPTTGEFIDFLEVADPKLQIIDISSKNLPQKMWSSWSGSASRLSAWISDRKRALADRRNADERLELVK
jgi:hypothetical protein